MATISNPALPSAVISVDSLTRLKQDAVVLIVDDQAMSGLMALRFCQGAKPGEGLVKEAKFFQVGEVLGSDADTKITNFKATLDKFVKEQFLEQLPNLIILDRNLSIGGLPVLDNMAPTEASELSYNDGPALIPFFKEWFPGVAIMGFTGEAHVEGMSSLYGGNLIGKPCEPQDFLGVLATSFSPLRS